MQSTRGVERVFLVLVPLLTSLILSLYLISYFILQFANETRFFLLNDGSNFIGRLQFKS